VPALEKITVEKIPLFLIRNKEVFQAPNRTQYLKASRINEACFIPYPEAIKSQKSNNSFSGSALFYTSVTYIGLQCLLEGQRLRMLSATTFTHYY
jgi:hypothetical protein